MVKGPGVVTGRSGTIGRIHWVEDDYWPHNTALWVTSFEHCYPKFAYYYLQHVGLERFAGGSGVPTLNRNDAHSFEITIPGSLDEQIRIASLLTDADDLIATLEQLLFKQQGIRHGTMQGLLSGRIRLPGFTDGWVPLRVASCSVLKARIGWQGLTTAEYRKSGAYRLVGGTEFVDGSLDWDAMPFVDKWRYDQDPGIQLRSGDILLTKDGSIGKTAFVDELPGPATLNSGVFVIRPIRNSYDSHFLYFMLRSRAFKDFLVRLSAGSTISHLYQRDLTGLVLDVPSTMEEQRAIVEVLRDIESEIATSRRRLAKARLIKIGMMQELLTGRTRLPAAEEAA
jgi:type I restriction enzyme S subunit